MARADKLLESLRANPRDRRIAEVEAVCRQHGLDFSMPKRGSHAKVSAHNRPEILTIPVRRPIKPIYIKKLIELIDSLRL